MYRLNFCLGKSGQVHWDFSEQKCQLDIVKAWRSEINPFSLLQPYKSDRQKEILKWTHLLFGIKLFEILLSISFLIFSKSAWFDMELSSSFVIFDCSNWWSSISTFGIISAAIIFCLSEFQISFQNYKNHENPRIIRLKIGKSQYPLTTNIFHRRSLI